MASRMTALPTLPNLDSQIEAIERVLQDLRSQKHACGGLIQSSASNLLPEAVSTRKTRIIFKPAGEMSKDWKLHEQFESRSMYYHIRDTARRAVDAKVHFIALRRNITYDVLPKDLKNVLRCEILHWHPQLAITYDNEWALDSILRSVVVARRRAFWKRRESAGAPPETESLSPQNSGGEAMHEDRSTSPGNETDMAQNERAPISCAGPRAPSKFRHKVPGHK